MEGQGNRQAGWVGANAEHRPGCVRVGLETEAFSPKLPQSQSFQHSPASLCNATTALCQIDGPLTPSCSSPLPTLRFRAERCRLARQANARC